MTYRSYSHLLLQVFDCKMKSGVALRFFDLGSSEFDTPTNRKASLDEILEK